MPDKSSKPSSKKSKKKTNGAGNNKKPQPARPIQSTQSNPSTQPSKKPKPPNKQPAGARPANAAAPPAEPQAALSPPPRVELAWRDGDVSPIAGIGASAGGLEALEKFFAHVPEQSGVAFVVIQHLDPTHKGMLVELLQRGTPIEVVQARDNTKVQKDHV